MGIRPVRVVTRCLTFCFLGFHLFSTCLHVNGCQTWTWISTLTCLIVSVHLFSFQLTIFCRVSKSGQERRSRQRIAVAWCGGVVQCLGPKKSDMCPFHRCSRKVVEVREHLPRKEDMYKTLSCTLLTRTMYTRKPGGRIYPVEIQEWPNVCTIPL